MTFLGWKIDAFRHPALVDSPAFRVAAGKLMRGEEAARDVSANSTAWENSNYLSCCGSDLASCARNHALAGLAAG
jgi:hypothetical protein